MRALWTGVNFTTGFESSPAVAGGVVFVGKSPATLNDQTNEVVTGLLTFDLNGCGAGQTICAPLSFAPTADAGVNLGPPLAIAHGTVYFVATDNTSPSGPTYIYAMTPP